MHDPTLYLIENTLFNNKKKRYKLTTEICGLHHNRIDAGITVGVGLPRKITGGVFRNTETAMKIFKFMILKSKIQTSTYRRE